MLASTNPGDFGAEVLRKVNDPEWGLDIKVDGRRLLLDMSADGGPRGFNRAGDRVEVPLTLWTFLDRAGPAPVYLDGELVGSTFWVFDIVGPTVPTGWEERRLTLDGFVKAWAPDPALIRVVPWATGKEGKVLLAQRVRNEGLEGLVAKRLGSHYHEGRSTMWVKLKDLKTVDCFVTRLGVDGKRNIELAVWPNDHTADPLKPIVIGEVSALTGDGPRVQVGDVVTVTFLYLGVNGRLVQPVKPMLRDDKGASECWWEQLPPAPGELA